MSASVSASLCGRAALSPVPHVRSGHARRGALLRVGDAQRMGSGMRKHLMRCRAADEGKGDETTAGEAKKGFGYTRLDVILICAGIGAAGVGGKAALEATGMDPLQAGNVVSFSVLVLMCAWTFIYVAKVDRKDMTYMKQLTAYEEAVMKKRLEEMSQEEYEELMRDIEK